MNSQGLYVDYSINTICIIYDQTLVQTMKNYVCHIFMRLLNCGITQSARLRHSLRKAFGIQI